VYQKLRENCRYEAIETNIREEQTRRSGASNCSKDPGPSYDSHEVEIEYTLFEILLFGRLLWRYLVVKVV
jgi:hypothetical protein